MDIKILRVPVIVIFANFLVFAIIPGNLTGVVGDVIYNVIRMAMIAYAGWLIVRNGGGTLRSAALAGLLLFAFDHVVLKGGKFMLDSFLYGESFDAFIGVLISFAMWFALPVAVAVVGGLVARHAMLKGSKGS